MQEVLVKEQKCKLNKGFSLVELIVVITIMAILVGVIATTFVRYVGSSRETANESNERILKDAADVALADPSVGSLGTLTASAPGTLVITWTATGVTTSGSLNATAFKTALDANLDKDSTGAVVYPEPSGGTGTFTITIVGSLATGYTSTVNFAETTPPAATK